MNKPVVFLAFANESPTNEAYLRNLRVELQQLTASFKLAEQRGLCELVVLTNATLSQLFDTFQDQRYRHRIALFHFGGHAHSYELLLEEETGTTKAISAIPFIQFLGKQKGLKLVFLNGCFSENQAKALIDGGIPAVIGTHHSIEDKQATLLATQFYKAIGEGVGIFDAWQDAVLQTLSEHGSADPNLGGMPFQASQARGLDLSANNASFPWSIFIKRGNESIKSWNLPAAAGDPYFGLPVPQTTEHLPNQPYRFLAPYRQKDALLFFGRGKEIRSVYQKLTSIHGAPIVLLFGQSGVGKSSFLQAGLIPRLAVDYEVQVVRRDPNIGLLGQLEEILFHDGHHELPRVDAEDALTAIEEDIQQLTATYDTLQGQAKLQLKKLIDQLQQRMDAISQRTVPFRRNLREKWMDQEKHSNKKGLILLFDQVEEVFTQPNEHLVKELDDFLRQLKTIFYAPNNQPIGKVLLSYRKEFDPEITALTHQHALPIEKVYLDRLQKKGIIEVVNGLNSSETLRQKYQLKIETGLPFLIANTLLQDRETPIAPVLQIILAKLWQLNEHQTDQVFSIEAYQKLLADGILLSDFFNQQMNILKNEAGNAETKAEASGLVLDLLYQHTTDLGTSHALSLDSLRQQYAHQQQVLDHLLKKLENLYLLTKPKAEQTKLAHDTLAPIIRKETDLSNRPGQVASRILESKMKDFHYFPESTIIEPVNLRLIEDGQHGMRLWLPKEKALIEKSKRKRRQNSLFRYLAIFTLIGMIVLGGISLFQHNQIQKQQQISQWISEVEFLSNKGNNNQALEIIKTARKTYPKDKALLQLQYNLYNDHEFFQRSWSFDHSVDWGNYLNSPVRVLILENGALKVLDQKGSLQQTMTMSSSISAIGVDTLNQIVIAGDQNGNLDILTFSGTQKLQIKQGHQARITAIAMAPRKRQFASAGNDGSWVLFDYDGQIISNFPTQQAAILCLSFNQEESMLAAGNRRGLVTLKDLKSGETTPYQAHQDRVLDLAFSPTKPQLATASRDASVKIWSLDQSLLGTLNRHQQRVNTISFSPNGQYLLTGSDDFQIFLWETEAFNLLKSYSGHEDYIHRVQFFNNGKEFISASADHTLKIWRKDSKALQTFDHQSQSVQKATFLNEGKYIATSTSLSNSATPSTPWADMTIWDVTDGQIIQTINSPFDQMTDFILSNNEKRIFLASEEGVAAILDLEGNQLQQLSGHVGAINQIALSKDEKLLATAGDDAQTIIWDLEKGAINDTLIGHESMVSAALFSSTNPWIFTSSYDSTIIRWNINGELLERVPAHAKRILGLAISPGSDFLLSFGLDNTAKLWHVGPHDLQLSKQFTIGQPNLEGVRAITSGAFSPDGQYVAIGSASGVATIYMLDGQPLQSVSDGGLRPVNDLVFSPDSKHILVAYSDGSARLYALL